MKTNHSRISRRPLKGLRRKLAISALASFGVCQFLSEPSLSQAPPDVGTEAWSYTESGVNQNLANAKRIYANFHRDKSDKYKMHAKTTQLLAAAYWAEGAFYERAGENAKAKEGFDHACQINPKVIDDQPGLVHLRPRAKKALNDLLVILEHGGKVALDGRAAAQVATTSHDRSEIIKAEEDFLSRSDLSSDVFESRRCIDILTEQSFGTAPAWLNTMSESVAGMISALRRAARQARECLNSNYLIAVQPQKCIQSCAMTLGLETEPSQVVQTLKTSSEARLLLADFKGAEADAKKAAELAPSDFEPQQLLAAASEHQAKYAEAISIYRELDKRASEADKWYGLFVLAKLYALSGDTAKAKELGAQGEHSYNPAKYSEGFKTGGDYPARSGEYYAAVSDYPEALARLSEGIAMLNVNQLNFPRSAHLQLLRAQVYAKMGKIAQAQHDIDDVARFFAESPLLETEAQKTIAAIGKGQAIASNPVRDRWALVIGISDFADPNIPRIKFASKDAADFAHLLTSQAGFKPDHVHVVTDSSATRQKILDELADKWLPSVVREDDAVLVFIASHGTPAAKDIGALNYLVTHDTQRDHLFSTGIAMQYIVNMLHDRLKNAHIFLVTDTCYSGATNSGISGDKYGNSLASDLLTSAHELILCSSSANQRSWDSRRYANGVFTGKLIHLLKARANFSDFHQVFEDLKQDVEAEVHEDYQVGQTPQLAGLWKAIGIFSTPGSK